VIYTELQGVHGLVSSRLGYHSGGQGHKAHSSGFLGVTGGNPVRSLRASPRTVNSTRLPRAAKKGPFFRPTHPPLHF
jgi:hypothetical protein